MPRFFIARPSKIYLNWDFWFENKPSGNPGKKLFGITGHADLALSSRRHRVFFADVEM
jgi:hypothetical protein